MSGESGDPARAVVPA